VILPFRGFSTAYEGKIQIRVFKIRPGTYRRSRDLPEVLPEKYFKKERRIRPEKSSKSTPLSGFKLLIILSLSFQNFSAIRRRFRGGGKRGVACARSRWRAFSRG
jgi:hypothetical protein